MKCIDCKFYEAHPEAEWAGICRITLPPHIHEAGNNFQSFAKADSGCDLGQAKVIAVEPVKVKAAKKEVEE